MSNLAATAWLEATKAFFFLKNILDVEHIDSPTEVGQNIILKEESIIGNKERISHFRNQSNHQFF